LCGSAGLHDKLGSELAELTRFAHDGCEQDL
jgi:hypothetical protein